MRTLLLLRGSPACGKTTWIKNNGLEQYALSADNIRLMCQNPMLLSDGKLGISQSNDKLVWKMLFQLLEARMERGEFTVIDATNSKTVEMNRYKDLAKSYRFRIFCVDFTDIPIEQCKRQNQLRNEYKQVPESVIDKMYSRFSTQVIPSGIEVIKPNELHKASFGSIDLSEYKVIHHIGDVHGCNTVLQEYLKDGIKDNEYYIFLGDYIDRGIENAEVINFLYSIMNLPNVCLLEGNHERWLWCWGNDQHSKSKEFETVTRKQLEENQVSKKVVRMLYRKLRQCAYYTYNDKTVLVTHGGLSKLTNNITTIATDQMIKGVGNYNDYEIVNDTFFNSTDNKTYQIHGHRNPKSLPIQLNDRCFDLEGSVEFGGNLRAVDLSHDDFNCIEIQNTVFAKPEPVVSNTEKTNIPASEVVQSMRDSKFVNEKKFGNISSFNFTRDAFYDKQWDNQTTKARGLYIDTTENKVVARAYEKFFNINERPETKFDNLQHIIKFPLCAYRKENGFLGIVGYDKEKDDLFITTKSNPNGDYAQWFKEIFYQQTTNAENLKQFIKDKNVSFVFEVIDINRDPHIIKYENNHMVLLDIVRNDIDFSKYNYEELQHYADEFNLVCKDQAYILNDWQEFYDWYNEVEEEDYEYKGKKIEGFVLEDSNGFMFKLKLWYYNNWKLLRGVAQDTLRKGYFTRTSALNTPLQNEFYGWIKTKYKQDVPTNIISLRDMFYHEKYGVED